MLAFSSIVAIVAGCGGGGTTSTPTPPPAPAPPQNITYSIDISSAPVDTTSSVGRSAEASITWSFSASSTTASSTSYTVSSATSGIQISGGSGSVAPGTSISTQLTYTCSNTGTFDAQITLSVGSSTETLTWSITCTEEQITFTPLEEVRVEQGEAALTTLTWTFETTGDAANSFAYEVVVESNRLQITNATGSSLPGNEIQHQLRYMCQEIGFHQVALQLRVGSATQRVEWAVGCTVEDIRAITAEFHQGPLLEQVEFSLLEDQWQAEVIPLFYHGQRPLRLGSNRQMFVTFAFETEVESQIDIHLETSNTADDVSIEKISTSNLPPNLSGTRTNYIDRTVFNVTASDLTTLGMLQIQLDPDDVVPQLNEAANDIVFDIARLEIVELPHLRLVLFPIISVDGEPDLTDTSFYEDVLYDLLPIGTYSVEVGGAIDLSSEESFDANAALDAIYDRWLTSADRDEFYHGIFKPPDVVDVCGIAHVGLNSGVTVEANGRCSANTIAHELGHNFSLNHAPACGAEDADPDPDYPYTDGSIGNEGGWLMRKQQPISTGGLTVSKIHDTMAYCLDSFTSQYSYGKANDFFVRRFGSRVAASEPPRREVAGFELIEGRSLVLMGFHSETEGWVLQKTEFVNKPPFPRLRERSEFELRLTHTASGTLLYRDVVLLIDVAHGAPHKKPWGLRIPAFNASGLHVAIVDRDENVLFEHEIGEKTK